MAKRQKLRMEIGAVSKTAVHSPQLPPDAAERNNIMQVQTQIIDQPKTADIAQLDSVGKHLYKCQT